MPEKNDNQSNYTLDELETLPAHQLIELSHMELDEHIAQASESERSARILKNWLTGIKSLKTRREQIIESQDRGDA